MSSLNQVIASIMDDVQAIQGGFLRKYSKKHPTKKHTRKSPRLPRSPKHRASPRRPSSRIRKIQHKKRKL